MPDLGKYTDTVLSAYAATIIIFAVLVVVSIVRSSKVKKQLEELEARRNG